MSAGGKTLDPAVLQGMRLFAGLDRDALADCARRARTRRIASGTSIFTQGEPAQACHALVDGQVKITQADGRGRRVIVRYIGPGEMFGAMGVFTGGAYLADAAAVSDCVEIRWPARAMTELMLRHPQIALNALSMVAHRLQGMQARTRELIAEPAERRLARALFRLAHQAGRISPRGVEIGFPLSRRDLADITGSTHYTASRALAEWAKLGVIESARKRVLVRDLKRLADIADGKIVAGAARARSRPASRKARLKENHR